MVWDGCQIGSPLGSSGTSGSCAMSIVVAFHSKNASKEAIKGAKGAKRSWLALLEAGFPLDDSTGPRVAQLVHFPMGHSSCAIRALAFVKQPHSRHRRPV